MARPQQGYPQAQLGQAGGLSKRKQKAQQWFTNQRAKRAARAGSRDHIPEVLLDLLPSADQVLSAPLHVHGEFVVDVFAGDLAITWGFMFSHVPCLLPWDLRFGAHFDVLKFGNVLEDLVSCGRLVAIAFATPCQSMTFCRVPQLRSLEFPLGLPSLTAKQRQLAHTGNKLCEFTVNLCLRMLDAGGYFSIENPLLSWLWLQPNMLQLLDKEGVAMH
eukprot:6480902-Amphidinium_carterae.1